MPAIREVPTKTHLGMHDVITARFPGISPERSEPSRLGARRPCGDLRGRDHIITPLHARCSELGFMVC